MKMKNMRFFIASSLVATVIAFAPFSSFAESNTGQMHQHNRQTAVFNFSSFFNRLRNSFDGYFTKKADAETTTTTGTTDNSTPTTSPTPAPIMNINHTPNISGITAPTVLAVGQTGTWDVRASDPQNGNLTYSVDWGDAVARPFALMAPLQPFVQTSTFTHAYAAAGDYTVTFTVNNDAGLTTTSKVTVHIIPRSTVTAPVVSDASATSTVPHQAVLTWTTDVKSSSLVWYSTTSPVDTSGDAQISRTAEVLNHKVTLTGLQPDTTYYAVVGSTNAGGTTLASETSFTTPALPDKTTPVITGLTGPETVTAGDTETVTVNAYDPQNGSLTYSADWGDTAPMMMSMLAPQSPFVQSAQFSHIYSTPGTYTATFTAQNDAGKTATSSMTITVTKPTTVEPVISSIGTQPADTTSTITWTTDEPTTSQIFYSTTTPVDVTSSDTASVSDTASTTNHSVTLSDLTANTDYHFIIQSTDASGNVGSSTESTFTTTSGS
jgi:hypothetical protein